MKIRVDIMPKEGVLDPQGKAIGHALTSLGFEGVQDVRMGKSIILTLDETDPQKAESTATAMAQKILANMVIEDFKVTILQ
ncbi:MAG: phosphoribosylformylglycinamidine synthase subunit PurS [Alphaproteobacteria bacterium]|nr:phosphoribosylformylglycinamidine synthase subunit PurS [Alphaproteobacteria bacterium]